MERLFTYTTYDLTFSFEHEGFDGDARANDELLRVYCLDKAGEELASICTQLPVGTSEANIARYADALNLYLEEIGKNESLFRSLERFVLEVGTAKGLPPKEPVVET